MRYTAEEKINICKLVACKFNEDQSASISLIKAVKIVLKLIRVKAGYEKLKLGTVLKWYEIHVNCQKRNKWKRQWKDHYKSVDLEFEQSVWSRLIIASLTKPAAENNQAEYAIHSNICATYDI